MPKILAQKKIKLEYKHYQLRTGWSELGTKLPVGNHWEKTRNGWMSALSINTKGSRFLYYKARFGIIHVTSP